MAYFLAVDAGGTKTDYVLADEERVLARVRSGTIKRLRTDAQTASAQLDFALQELAASTGIASQEVRRTCIGTAGETVPLVTDWLREAFGSRVAGELILVGDVQIALDAAFQGGPGVLVLAGTGSNVAGRSAEGRIVRAGGWGPALADQGSGHSIGLSALRAAFLARDERRPSSLLGSVAKFWKLESEEQLIGYANALPAPDFSSLTEVVLACALAGDEVAAAVLRTEGEELGYLVQLVLAQLADRPGVHDGLPPIAFAGSIMEKVPPVRTALLEFVARAYPQAHIQARAGVVDPIDGALWMARGGGGP